MLATFLSFAISAATPAPEAPQEDPQIEADRTIIRELDKAMDDYKKWLSTDCVEEDHKLADLAARAAAITEERAIRTRNLAQKVDRTLRAEYEGAAADLFIEASDFWLKALSCRPSRSMYREHAELPLHDADSLVQLDVERASAIMARRDRIARHERRDLEPSEEPVRCAQGDRESVELVARQAALTLERAIRARALAESATLEPPNGRSAGAGEPGPRYRTGGLFLEAARLWVRAWDCRPSALLYLDNAESALGDAQRSAPGTAVSHDADELRAVISANRMKMWTERFALRLEFGYGTGRLARAKYKESEGHYEDSYRAHRGPYLGVSALLRVPPKAGRVHILVGPYYGYWRALEKSIISDTSDADVHEFGAKAEVAVGFTPKVAKVITLHMGLDLALQYVDFDSRSSYAGPGTVSELVDPEYTDITGSALGASMGTCFLYSSLCATVRVQSVPHLWKNRIPTLRAGIAIDLMRLARAVLERRSLRPQGTRVPHG